MRLLRVPDHLLVLSRVSANPVTTCRLSKLRVRSRVSFSISSKVPRKRSARDEPPRLTRRSTVSGVLFSRVRCCCSFDEQAKISRREKRNAGTVVAYNLSRGWTVLMPHPLSEECKNDCGNRTDGLRGIHVQPRFCTCAKTAFLQPCFPSDKTPCFHAVSSTF